MMTTPTTTVHVENNVRPCVRNCKIRNLIIRFVCIQFIYHFDSIQASCDLCQLYATQRGYCGGKFVPVSKRSRNPTTHIARVPAFYQYNLVFCSKIFISFSVNCSEFCMPVMGAVWFHECVCKWVCVSLWWYQIPMECIKNLHLSDTKYSCSKCVTPASPKSIHCLYIGWMKWHDTSRALELCNPSPLTELVSDSNQFMQYWMAGWLV